MPAAIVDAFTDRPFAGNPAAVVLLDGDRVPPDSWLQDMAAELRLSETAFLVPLRPGRYGLRWFTPVVEVALCGHATLASAHWLFETGQVDASGPDGGTVLFETRSGQLRADGRPGSVRINLPAVPVATTTTPPGFDKALGFLSYELLGLTGQPEPRERNAMILVHPTDLRDLTVNLRKLADLPLGGLIVTAPADAEAAAAGVDVLSRYFAPARGIDEDPVTGSAHCTLADYWTRRLGRTGFRAMQLSQRGGVLDVSLEGIRVQLTGGAVTVMDITLRV